MARIIALSNQKGGVGKTTTSISLGACLAKLGYKTLIIDLDSQSNLTMATGLDPDSLDYAIPDLLETDHSSQTEISKVIHPTSVDGLFIIPSDIRLASTERLLYDIPEYENTLSQLLSGIKEQFSYILIDCPPSLGALTLMALTAAHTILIPVQCEYYSARGLMRLVEVIDAVKQHTNPNLDYRLVVTLYDKRNKITQRVYDQLRENFGDIFFETLIRVDTKLRECSVIGEPITTYAPNSRSSQDYLKLAQEVIQTLK